MPYQTVNPFNGEVVRTFNEHTDQQMEQMLANADKTFRQIWSKKPVLDRAKIVGKAASLRLEQRRQRRNISRASSPEVHRGRGLH